jgi:hypothetical protein
VPRPSKHIPAKRLLGLLVALAIVLGAPAMASAASGWSVAQLAPKPGDGSDPAVLTDVSCPSASLCVAVGALDTIATSTSPTGGTASWSVVYPLYAEPQPKCLERGESATFCETPRGALDTISCAGEGLCVAAGYEGTVFTSTDPSAGSGAWSVNDVRAVHGSPHLTSVSCPSTSLCVAVSGGNGVATGNVLTSTDPTSGQWQPVQLGGAPDLQSVSCATTSLCVAVAKGGGIYTSTDPTGGASAWRSQGSPGGARDLYSVSCVVGLCAAGDDGGNVLTTTDPTGVWTKTNTDGTVQLPGIDCPTAQDCVAVDNDGSVLTSTDPTGGAAAWTFQNLVPFEAEPEDFGQFVKNALFGVSCASTSLCALVGANSRIFTSTEPFAAAPPTTTGTTSPAGTPAHHGRKRPRTKLVFAEHFWKGVLAHHGRAKASFHFYSREGARGFVCKKDRGGYRRCHSPLRHWARVGSHILRVRAIGPTGLRGPVAMLKFRVYRR